MAQKQLSSATFWLEIEQLGKLFELPTQLDSREKCDHFLEETTTPQKLDRFLRVYFWGEEVDISKVTDVEVLLTKITNILQSRYPVNAQGFQKVKNYYTHVLKYESYISKLYRAQFLHQNL